MFCCEFYDIFKNIFFTETLLATASGMCKKYFPNRLTGLRTLRTLKVRELKVTFTLITFCPNLKSFFFDIFFSFCNVNFGILCNGFNMIGASVVSPMLSCISLCTSYKEPVAYHFPAASVNWKIKLLYQKPACPDKELSYL